MLIYLVGFLATILGVVMIVGALVGACYLAQELRCWSCGGEHSCGCRPP